MKKKLNINKLEVQSFITEIEKDNVKGGFAAPVSIFATGCCTGTLPTSPLLICVTHTTNNTDTFNCETTKINCE